VCVQELAADEETRRREVEELQNEAAEAARWQLERHVAEVAKAREEHEEERETFEAQLAYVAKRLQRARPTMPPCAGLSHTMAFTACTCATLSHFLLTQRDSSGTAHEMYTNIGQLSD
jgi:septal ring factor EnvC (AmiA/AmiB activator)